MGTVDLLQSRSHINKETTEVSNNTPLTIKLIMVLSKVIPSLLLLIVMDTFETQYLLVNIGKDPIASRSLGKAGALLPSTRDIVPFLNQVESLESPKLTNSSETSRFMASPSMDTKCLEQPLPVKVDCHPEMNATKERCEARDCCWNQNENPFCFFPKLNCIWSTWNEGPCTETCGKGMKIITRVKIQEEAFGGTCEGEESKIEECKMRDCPPPQRLTPVQKCCVRNGLPNHCLSYCKQSEESLVSRSSDNVCLGKIDVIAKCQNAQEPAKQYSPRERCCLGQGVPTQCLAGCQQNSTAIQSRSQGGSTCANHINKIMRCHRNEGELSLCTEYSFGQCLRPIREFGQESTEGQRSAAECQKWGNDLFPGYKFYTFRPGPPSVCTVYTVDLIDYLDGCQHITGSPDHPTNICVKPTINTCNAFGRTNCDRSWDMLESGIANTSLEECRLFCKQYRARTCSHFQYDRTSRRCVLYGEGRPSECDVVFGPPEPAYNHCFSLTN